MGLDFVLDEDRITPERDGFCEADNSIAKGVEGLTKNGDPYELKIGLSRILGMYPGSRLLRLLEHTGLLQAVDAAITGEVLQAAEREVISELPDDLQNPLANLTERERFILALLFLKNWGGRCAQYRNCSAIGTDKLPHSCRRCRCAGKGRSSSRHRKTGCPRSHSMQSI